MNRSLNMDAPPVQTNRMRTSLDEVRESTYYWDRADVLSRADSRMRTAFAEVHERAQREQVSLGDAAYLIAVGRMAHACRERGWV